MVLYSFIWCFTYCMVFSSTLFNFIRSFLILFFFFGWSYLDKCRYNKLTTQLLLSFFKIEGVVHYGIAGSANPSLNIGDVAIPQYWGHTALWSWQVDF